MIGDPVTTPGGPEDVARMRAALYRLHAGAFGVPDAKRWDRLAGEGRELLEGGADRFPFHGPLAALLGHLEHGGPATASAVETHARLFAAATGSGPCPPHGCHYLRQDPAAEADTLAQLDAFYGSLGLEAPSERTDHLSVELEALGVLCLLEAEAGTAGDAASVHAAREAGERFLAQHLLRWFPRFRDAVRIRDPAGPFAAAVASTHAFLVHEHNFLRALLAAQAGPGTTLGVPVTLTVGGQSSGGDGCGGGHGGIGCGAGHGEHQCAGGRGGPAQP
jgi:putative dimethyl sulfoxide reductase chaperone